jgi:hypothetical protein
VPEEHLPGGTGSRPDQCGRRARNGNLGGRERRRGLGDQLPFRARSAGELVGLVDHELSQRAQSGAGTGRRPGRERVAGGGDAALAPSSASIETVPSVSPVAGLRATNEPGPFTSRFAMIELSCIAASRRFDSAYHAVTQRERRRDAARHRGGG